MSLDHKNSIQSQLEDNNSIQDFQYSGEQTYFLDTETLVQQDSVKLNKVRESVAQQYFQRGKYSNFTWIGDPRKQEESKELAQISQFGFIFCLYSHTLSMAIFSLPCAYLIEKIGVNKSMTLAIGLNSIGLWFGYLEFYTIGLFIAQISQPISGNLITKISALWFGPKGRVLVITGSVICQTIPLMMIDKRLDSYLGPYGLMSLAIICAVLVPITLILFYDKPDFAPTISEEAKEDRTVCFKEDLASILSNKSFLSLAIASIFLLVNIRFFNQVIRRFFMTSFGIGKELTYMKQLIYLSMLSVFLLQTLAIILQNNPLLVITNIYDALFRGGMMVIIYEISAEFCYPYSEVIAIAFINSISCFIQWVMMFTVGMFAFPTNKLETEIRQTYIIYLALFAIMTILQHVLIRKANWIQKRYKADSSKISKQNYEQTIFYSTTRSTEGIDSSAILTTR
ncbi:UNKNOWN [Stylonychia lemnae]|uniref:Major facilitator superfamily protein n=1 Tax=Stylonychia lemnae TaxID=5949 RepID=A0A078B897_STYLE|nr:UNKNOWN [Stylonychia lemnae]|eukprot:CDW90629.1 UNKNOWN [Stylonychia lemnae]